jgi:hypothetical protein
VDRARRRPLRPWPDESRQASADRQTASLAALALVLALVVLGLVLVNELRQESHLEDCLMQNRTNCDMLTQQAQN